MNVDPRKNRANLRCTGPGFGRVKWHRLVCYAFAGVGLEMPDDKEADHTNDKWWEVRKDHLEYVSGEVNRERQGEAGLAGAAGDRKRRGPPKMGENKKKARK